VLPARISLGLPAIRGETPRRSGRHAIVEIKLTNCQTVDSPVKAPLTFEISFRRAAPSACANSTVRCEALRISCPVSASDRVSVLR
jgi:hypothetical protein